jgi:hypothetical protein
MNTHASQLIFHRIYTKYYAHATCLLQTRVVQVNDRKVEAFGMSRVAFLAKLVLVRLDPDKAALVRAAFGSCTPTKYVLASGAAGKSA